MLETWNLDRSGGIHKAGGGGGGGGVAYVCMMVH